MRPTLLFAGWMLVAAATMFVGALAHTAIPIPLVDQPTIVPATIVESITGTAFLVGAVSLLARRQGGFKAAVVAHVIAIAGFLLGILAPDGDTANTLLNWYYHRLMLVALAVGLLLLILPGPRRRLESHDAAG